MSLEQERDQAGSVPVPVPVPVSPSASPRVPPTVSPTVSPELVVAGDVVRDVDPAAVQRRIVAERAALGRTVEELAARLDWKAQLRRQVGQAASAAQGAGATALRAVGTPARQVFDATARRLWKRLRRST